MVDWPRRAPLWRRRRNLTSFTQAVLSRPSDSECSPRTHRYSKVRPLRIITGPNRPAQPRCACNYSRNEGRPTRPAPVEGMGSPPEHSGGRASAARLSGLLGGNYSDGRVPGDDRLQVEIESEENPIDRTVADGNVEIQPPDNSLDAPGYLGIVQSR